MGQVADLAYRDQHATHFYKPDLDGYKSRLGKLMQPVSLHNHTVASQQSLLVIEGMTPYDKFVKISKKHGILPAVTDHDRTLALPFLRRICEREDWDFIPGIEASTPLGHVAFYGRYDDIINFAEEFAFKHIQGDSYEDRVWQGVEMMRKVMRTGKYRSNIVHFTDVMNTGIGTHDMPDAALEMVKLANMVEMWNAINSVKSNWYTWRAARIFKKHYGKRVVIGSDSHRVDLLGTNYNIYDLEDRGVDAVLKAMGDQDPADVAMVHNVDFKYMKDWIIQRVDKSWRHVERILDSPIRGEGNHWYYRLSESDRLRKWGKKIGRHVIENPHGRAASMLEILGTYGCKAGELSFFKDSPAKDYEKIKATVREDMGVYISDSTVGLRDFTANPYTYLRSLLYEKPVGKTWTAAVVKV